MNTFMKIVLIVAIVAIIAGIVGGVINYNDRKAEFESREDGRSARIEEYKNCMQDGEDCDMMDRGNFEGGKGSRGFSNNGNGKDRSKAK